MATRLDPTQVPPIVPYGGVSAVLAVSRPANPHAHFTATDRDAETRRCAICGETKPLGDYYRNRVEPFGRAYRCKACTIETDVRGHAGAEPFAAARSKTLTERLRAKRQAEAS